MKLNDIQCPKDIKSMNIDELNELASEIREFLIESISKTGGHLSSNLGVVELSIALHYVFDSPEDKIIFDVGHQSYIHKILTGRLNDFEQLRKFEGLSGFQKRYESEHDVWEAGHASTSLSAALGMAVARDLDNDSYQVIPVIGDGSLPNGMAFEALNQIGSEKRNMIIIFNDNDMSISKPVGAVNDAFTNLRTNKSYVNVKDDLRSLLSRSNFGKGIFNAMKSTKDAVKQTVVPDNIFKEFGLDYIGPVDGHDLDALIRVLQTERYHKGPIVVHVRTTKGKGYSYAENDQDGSWHGVGPFNIETGEAISSPAPNTKSWSEIVSNALIRLAKDNDDIVCITPAMIGGSKLTKFFNTYPKRSFDCGIAEEHAMTFAAGLAANGKRPFISIYSSFLQRAYDQVNHDIARMDLPVVIGIDRSGLVGDDGETHHGVFDIGFLRSLPNVILAEGKDPFETQNLLYTAFKQSHPFALRYPRGNAVVEEVHSFKEIEIGTWEYPENLNSDKVIVAYGPDVVSLQQELNQQGLDIPVINARFIKPLDNKVLDLIQDKKLVIYEPDMKAGGLASSILEYYSDKGHCPCIDCIGLGDEYVEQGNVELLKVKHKVAISDVINQCK